MDNLEQIVKLQNENMVLKAQLDAINNTIKYLDSKYLDMEDAEECGEVPFYDIKWIIKSINKILKGGN